VTRTKGDPNRVTEHMLRRKERLDRGVEERLDAEHDARVREENMAVARERYRHFRERAAYWREYGQRRALQYERDVARELDELHELTGGGK
jgi:hypothetical protein